MGIPWGFTGAWLNANTIALDACFSLSATTAVLQPRCRASAQALVPAYSSAHLIIRTVKDRGLHLLIILEMDVRVHHLLARQRCTALLAPSRVAHRLHTRTHTSRLTDPRQARQDMAHWLKKKKRSPSGLNGILMEHPLSRESGVWVQSLQCTDYVVAKRFQHDPACSAKIVGQETQRHP